MRLRSTGIAAVLAAAIFVCGEALAATVPFVGCPSDGQSDALPPPKGAPVVVKVSDAVAARLAFYKPENGPGVLGPRGWFCAGAYGSNGQFVVVSDERVDATQLVLGKVSISGYGIQLGDSLGGTSGRFEFARIAARVFPSQWPFVRRVIAEDIEPASSFVFKPYPHDTLRYQGQNAVEFITPPNTMGLGTLSKLVPNGEPISGVAIVLTEGDMALRLAAIRLPAAMRDMAPIIIARVEANPSE